MQRKMELIWNKIRSYLLDVVYFDTYLHIYMYVCVRACMHVICTCTIINKLKKMNSIKQLACALVFTLKKKNSTFHFPPKI